MNEPKEPKSQATDKRNQRRAGFYWKDGKPYVSVTTVLKIIDKPAIRYWFGKEVYLAMVIDPTLNESAALSAPYRTSKKAQNRGTTIHSIVEAYKASGVIIETVPDHLKGYAEAFYSWVKDNKLEIEENEKTVVNEKHQFAGTLDMLVKINGEEYVLDVKTGKDIYPESTLQLSAYNETLGGTRKMAVLLLKENGKYKFETVESEFDAFLHCKALWEWANKALLVKVGYKTDGGETL